MRSNFHQVQSMFFGDLKGLFQRFKTKLLILFVDQTNRRNANLPIDAKLFADTKKLINTNGSKAELPTDHKEKRRLSQVFKQSV